jgi:hypothetical protein
VVHALVDAGVFRLLVPPALGGAGASPPQQLLSGQVPTIGAIARRERIAPRYVRDLLSLAFLSPRIVKTIVEGRLPPELIVIGLTRRIDIPLLWSARERGLGLRDLTRPVPSQSRRSKPPSGVMANGSDGQLANGELSGPRSVKLDTFGCSMRTLVRIEAMQAAWMPRGIRGRAFLTKPRFVCRPGRRNNAHHMSAPRGENR